MSENKEIEQAGRVLALLPALTIAAAVGLTAATAFTALDGLKTLTLEATFVYGAGGTKVTAYVQTSLDAGVTWTDIACFTFTTAAAKKISKVSVYAAVAASVTPTDGTLADDTILDGVLGDQFRVKTKSTGTYTGATSLTITATAKA